MKVKALEVFQCDAGWRPWTFVKIVTDSGFTGWSECSDSFGSAAGVAAVIHDLAKHVVGEDPFAVEKIYWKLYSATRQSPGSIIQKAIAGIENALLDVKAKALGVPVYELLGGAVRDKLRLYWSHCGTTRVRSADLAKVPPVNSLSDLKPLAEEVKRRGFTAVKTNPVIFGGVKPYVYMPGFGRSDGGPELNVTRNLIESIKEYVGAFREALGGGIDLILDLNFNFKTEGYIQIARALAPYDLMWLEIDSYDSLALRQIKDASPMPICSGENLYGTRDYRLYFENHSMDIASVDLLWNGLWQSKKIADLAELYEMNVAPHNHYSHLAGLMTAHFSVAIPNFRIMETDVDDVPWKDELVTAKPVIENGHFIVSNKPGWGADINEEVLKEHPWSQ